MVCAAWGALLRYQACGAPQFLRYFTLQGKVFQLQSGANLTCCNLPNH